MPIIDTEVVNGVTTNILYGDTLGSLVKHQQAGSQTLSAFVGTIAVGDARTIKDHATGGNDTLQGSGFVAGQSGERVRDNGVRF
jgi:hypothetical protein